MSYQMEVTSGLVQAGFYEAMFIPDTIRGNTKYPLIVLHGASSVAAVANEYYSCPSLLKLCAVAAEAGIPVITAFAGGNAWANDAVAGSPATSYINKMLAAVAARTGCSSSKAIVGGLSMGGGTAVRWASQNLAKAAGVFGHIPMASINRLYAENPSGDLTAGSFALGIATAWGLAQRQVANAATTNGSTNLTSATAAFTSADIGRQVIRPYTQTAIQADTKIASITSATVAVMSKPATATASGLSIQISDPLPLAGVAGADLIGVHAPRIASAGIQSRIYYGQADPYILPADSVALGTALAADTVGYAGLGHDCAVPLASEGDDGGVNFASLLGWFQTLGA